MARSRTVSLLVLVGGLPIGLAALAGERGGGETRNTPAPRAKEGRTMRIAAAQPRLRLIDYRLPPAEALARAEESLGELEALVKRAGAEGCDALALPEDTLGLLHWEAGNKSRLKEVLPRAVGRMLARLGAAAAAQRLYLVCCNDVAEPDGTIYNTAFFLGRDGKEIGRYRKVNMPLHELDRRRGNGFPVFETPDLGGVGMLICYDMVFPEAPRCLALGGADVIFFPTLGGAAIGDGEIARAAIRTRAVENFVYLVVSQRGGGARVISPQGKILAEGQGTDALAIADIDPFGGRDGGDALNHQEDMRARLFRERSPAAFGILTDPNPPVLKKVPEKTTIAEAVRVGSATLTVGNERFSAAEALLRAGKKEEARQAFERLRAEFPRTWIDREARKRLQRLAGEG